jgi:hypothetical protein
MQHSLLPLPDTGADAVAVAEAETSIRRVAGMTRTSA